MHGVGGIEDQHPQVHTKSHSTVLRHSMELRIAPALHISQHVSSVSLSLCMKGHDCNNVRTFCSFSWKIGVQETEVCLFVCLFFKNFKNINQ